MKKIKSVNRVTPVLMTCLLLILSVSTLSAQLNKRNILAAEAKEINLEASLIDDYSWNKMPGFSDRQFWDNISPELRQKYIDRAARYLDYNWPVVKATDYLEFVRSGDRRQEMYEAPSSALNALVTGELMEGKGRFIDQIINAVWYYSEQTWWGWSAHLYFQKAPEGLPDPDEPTIDLGVGEIASDLAWTWYLFRDEFDKVHPVISKRLRNEIMKKATDPYFERNDFGYMGFSGERVNNWNPWVNLNMLNCYVLLENDPGRRRASVMKIVNSLDNFLNGYPDDGGCDEGPSYWGAAGALLYENLALLKDVTGGKFDVFDNQLIKNIGSYFNMANIHAPYFLNFADADATTSGNPADVYLYGKAIGDVQLQQFGAYLARLDNWGDGPFDGKIAEQIRNLSLLREMKSAEAKEALVKDFWLPQTEVAGARDTEGSSEGFYFGAKGGFNAESHNHNDVGSFVLYYDGQPCIIDLGREKYTARTFSPRRYEIWTMQSQYHNLPLINGIGQKDGEEYKAKNSGFSANARKAVFTTDISSAYPKEAMVKSWIRSYTLNRGKSFIVRDKYILDNVSDLGLATNFITCCKVSQVKPGVLQLEGKGFSIQMNYDARLVEAAVEFIPVNDEALKRYWPDGVTRISMKFRSNKRVGSNTITFTHI